ncbi:hypothetical protein ITP53_23565 [Nonomuraea sp. K274]|uniref:Lipoprotein n=1 Tax=Nonomuraea cypriaca TaxID=1187855 RepID=A0A931A940_9ACTN|nr:hypothetical protein [Nonomuraea cypriaca]MBF8188652.1 hypothetical protein [Nonomuraea cypriaca]
MFKSSRLTLAMPLAAAVLCGCGGTAESAATSPSPSPAAGKKQRFEAIKADCMKQQGFKYVAYVPPKQEKTEEERKRAAGDYQAMLKYRQKYGFGAWAFEVYPEEMMRQSGADAAAADPNMKIVSKLSTAQAQAYMKAKDTCAIRAGKQALGLTLKSASDHLIQMLTAREQAIGRELDGDPGLVELAAAMAGCMKSKGHTFDDTKPTAMADRGRIFATEQTRLREHVSSVQARQHLNKEIKAALDDLECGKSFYPAYEPRQTAIGRRIDDQFAWHLP